MFRYRDALFPVVVILALVQSLPPAIDAGTPWAAVALVVGGLLALAGQVLRTAVIGYAYIVRGGKDGKAHAEELVCQGFFAHARHPLYTGNQMIAFGVCLMFGTPFSVFVVLPLFWLLYRAMALNEEDFLISKFGDAYRHYQRDVPRFIPNLQGLSESLAPFTYDWRRALRKDYGQMTLVLAAVLVLNTWRLRDLRPWIVPAGQALGVLLAVTYLSVRFMKKRRLLETPAKGAIDGAFGIGVE